MGNGNILRAARVRRGRLGLVYCGAAPRWKGARTPRRVRRQLSSTQDYAAAANLSLRRSERRHAALILVRPLMAQEIALGKSWTWTTVQGLRSRCQRLQTWRGRQMMAGRLRPQALLVHLSAARLICSWKVSRPNWRAEGDESRMLRSERGRGGKALPIATVVGWLTHINLVSGELPSRYFCSK